MTKHQKQQTFNNINYKFEPRVVRIVGERNERQPNTVQIHHTLITIIETPIGSL